MDRLLSLFRLGLGGLLLDTRAFQAQRDDEGALRRGLLLVLLVGLLVGVATLLGDLLESLAQPSPQAVNDTLYQGLRAMPWYEDAAGAIPDFEQQFDQIFEQFTRLSSLIGGGGLAGSLAGVLTTPLLYLLGWLIYGLFAHVLARALGGRGSLGQTLSCTALAAGANLLALVHLVPFAQESGAALLGLMACFLALREAHGLSGRRAFWATALGPLLLILLAVGLGCAALFVLVGAASAA